jgi:hypothetical protein
VADIILHHYPESPFAEKIRLILGYKGLNYRSVTIPMSRPSGWITGRWRILFAAINSCALKIPSSGSTVITLRVMDLETNIIPPKFVNLLIR